MKCDAGKVYLVGAGPGDPGLITVRGLELLRQADVILHDRLIPHELLREARADAIITDVGKFPGAHRLAQDEINALLINHARAGRCVVRLKGGDPFVFGRGFEEMSACHDAGIACEVVPGVSSAVAGPTAAGIPITHRGVARNFAVVTARTGESDDASDLDYAALARIDTLIVLMGRGNLREVAAGLTAAGRDASTPVACIEQATTSAQRVVAGVLCDIADHVDEAGLRPPVVTVIGEVARYAGSTALPGSTSEVLSGRVVAVTGTKTINQHLRASLEPRGAKVIECPLIDIEFEAADKAAEMLSHLHEYDWLVFTSVHGARGFVSALQRCAMDIVTLRSAQIAAVGPSTRDELSAYGLRVDFMPTRFCAAALVEQLGPQVSARRVLLPCGDHARPELAEGLSTSGACVDQLLVYRNVPHRPAAEMLEQAGAADIVVLSSPTAVRQFIEVGLAARGVSVACLGPTTASAARRAGLPVSVVAEDHRAEGMVHALEAFFSCCEVLL